MSFDWKSLIGTLAPTIATALGGPLAGLATKTLSTAILGNENGSEEDISIALAGANAETLAQVKKADQDFKVALKRLDVKLEELKVKDVASARSRQVELKDKTPTVLVALLTVGLFGILTGLFFLAIPEANKETVYILLGSYTTAWLASVQYFVGTTRGSARKDMLMNGK